MLTTTSADRLNARGIEFVQSGRLDDAHDAFSAAVLADHRNARAWNNRGLVRRLTGRVAEALFDFDMAVAHDPSAVEALGNRAAARKASGDLAGADADLTVAIERAGRAGDRAGWLTDRAAVRLVAGDAATAKADADAALALTPDADAALEIRGQANLALGDLVAAKADLDRALAVAPPQRLARLYHARAAVAVARRRFADAVADYDLAVAADPRCAMAYISRGHARYHLSDPRALDDYRAAFRLDAPAAAAELVRIARRQVAEEPAATLANCRKHAAARPDDALGCLRLGVTLWLLGDTAEATGWLARGRALAAADGPEIDRVLAVLGRTARRAGGRGRCPARTGRVT